MLNFHFCLELNLNFPGFQKLHYLQWILFIFLLIKPTFAWVEFDTKTIYEKNDNFLEIKKRLEV